MKIYDSDDWCFNDIDKAIEFMYKTNFKRDVAIYDINDDKAYEKILKLYEEIKKYNKGKPLDDQILPTTPYKCRAIKGCLGVVTYDISLGTYKDNHDKIALFCNWKESVLDNGKEYIDIRPSLKALSSLSMLLSMPKLSNSKEEDK